MKRLLYTSLFTILLSGFINSQCVQTCSNYFVSPVQFTMAPTAGDSLFLQNDDLSAPIPIGFTFNFMCSNYSKVVVSSNGFMTFDTTAFNNGCCQGNPIPSPGSTPNNMVALAWTDLYPPGNGSITYTTVGVSPNQVFILTYSAIPACCGNTADVTGQIKLYQSDNSIEIHSKLISNNIFNNITQGIEDSSGTIGVPAPGANGVSYTTTNTAYRWSNNIPTPPGTVSGPTTVCTGIANTFSVAPMPGATSYSWALPGGWTGTSTTNVISATAGSAGNLSVAAVYTCGTSYDTTTAVTIIPSPTVSINGNTASICPGSQITLTASGANSYSWSSGPATSTIALSPTVNTTYSVTGTSSLTGCTSNAITTVSVFPKPIVATAGSGTVCSGLAQSIAANGAISYTWQPGNLTGFLISVSPSVSTVYTVTGISSDGCTNTATANVVVIQCAGLKTNSNSIKNLLVYPNPNNGEFVIELKNNSVKAIEITDYTGKIVYSASSSKDSIGINLNTLSNGVYFVKVRSQDEMEVVKILKQ